MDQRVDRRRVRILGPVVVPALAVCLSACGSDAEDTEPRPPSASPSSCAELASALTGGQVQQERSDAYSSQFFCSEDK